MVSSRSGNSGSSGDDSVFGEKAKKIFELRRGKNESRFQLVRFQFDGRALVKICANGASELMSNISMSFVGMLYNIQLMKYAGENGVAAYGVLMYVSMVFQAVFLGYAVGMAPVVSYHYGAGNKKEVKNLLCIVHD